MSSRSTLNLLSEHLGSVFGLLADAFGSEAAVTKTLRRIGWFPTAIPNEYVQLGTAAAQLVTAIEQSRSNGANDLATAKALLGSIKGISDGLGQLTAPSGTDGTQFSAEFPESLINMLIVDYLAQSVPALLSTLEYLGIVQVSYAPTVPPSGTGSGRPAIVSRTIDYSVITELFTDPTGIPTRAFGWGTTDFQFEKAIAPLLELANSVGLSAGMETISPILRDNLQPTLTRDDNIANAAVIQVADVVVANQPVQISFALMESPVESGHPLPGVALMPLLPQISESVRIGANTTATITGAVDPSSVFAMFLRPKEEPEVRFPLGSGQPPTATVGVDVAFAPATPGILLGVAGASRLEATGATLSSKIIVSQDGTEVLFQVVAKGNVIVNGGDGDGFLGSVLGNSGTTSPISFGFQWSNKHGVGLVGGGTFILTIPANLAIGPIVIKQLRISVTASASGQSPALLGSASLDFAVELGPVIVTVQDLGTQVSAQLKGGNAGRFGLDVGFKAPAGLGISIDAGSVHGGGFISFDPTAGRYSGALQLSIYDIAVSAFGLVETKVPGVSYSFIIIISAQFTPIQLGFGFTLNGVGGMVGINRAIDTTALANLVRAGQSEELLFPKNVIADAPTIVRDLTSVFPATQSHYVFGPLGKLGWGTPTLITGEIGVILEFPGPVVVLLGEVKCLLPKPDQALVKLNLSIDGELDFPNKLFAMDAALHDSVINGFPVSGQMAMRVNWGDNPNFIFSIGGFHPAYTPPPNFPKLQPMTLDLGSHGAAKISVSGFFAVTSNTVQVGGSATLHAGGSGITLDASVSVKALFVFQPFSFEADIAASVKVSFHGYGIGVNLSGTLDGPSPWHIKGEVCVSVLWWDACLGFDVTFGGDTQVTQPSIDPWVGVASSDPTTAILGLHDALSDAGNWAAALVPGTVSSVARAQGTDTLIDPVGGITVRQKTAPVETQNPLTRFGVAKTPKPISFSGVKATLGDPSAGPTVPLTAVEPVNEPFAPAQFFDMDDGKKLSSPGFEQYQAGYVFATDANNANVQGGSAFTFMPQLVTWQINSDGSETQIANYTPTDEKVAAANQRSAVAKGGLTQAGTRRFVNRAFVQAFSEVVPSFVIGDNTTLLQVDKTPAAAVRSATLIALDAFRAQNLEQAAGLQVTALHELSHG